MLRKVFGVGMIKNDKNIRKEIIRYLIAGALVGCTDFSTYYFLIHFLSLNLSKGISFVCAGIVAYLFNKYWIFPYSKFPSYVEVGRYVFINVLALGINVLTNQSIIVVWPKAIFVAFITAAMATGLFTFFCYKWWVFKAQLIEPYHGV